MTTVAALLCLTLSAGASREPNAVAATGKDAPVEQAAKVPEANLKQAYKQDFSKEDTDYEPLDVFVLDGEFIVRERDGQKLLELSPTPLNDFGLLFGPRHLDNVAAQASVRADRQGRRMPAFGVGICGRSGWALRMNGGTRRLELLQAGIVRATAPFKWRSGEWTHLKIQLLTTGEKAWTVSGKAWQAEEEEPEDWQLALSVTEEPPIGKASAWGTPYAGRVIQFDDLVFFKAATDEDKAAAGE